MIQDMTEEDLDADLAFGVSVLGSVEQYYLRVKRRRAVSEQMVAHIEKRHPRVKERTE